jgi:hypothetical protein
MLDYAKYTNLRKLDDAKYTNPRKLDYSKYMNHRKYPTRLSVPRLASNTPTEAEINKYLSEVKEFDKAKVEYEKNLAAYQEAKAERIRQFKVDLFVAYGVTGHPKAEKAFELAWEFGHSGGLHEVELYFSTLVTLIKH